MTCKARKAPDDQLPRYSTLSPYCGTNEESYAISIVREN